MSTFFITFGSSLNCKNYFLNPFSSRLVLNVITVNISFKKTLGNKLGQIIKFKKYSEKFDIRFGIWYPNRVQSVQSIHFVYKSKNFLKLE